MAAIESIWFSFILLVMIWRVPLLDAQNYVTKKIHLYHRNTKMVKPWIANDKIENSGEIFSRLGNVTKLKD